MAKKQKPKTTFTLRLDSKTKRLIKRGAHRIGETPSAYVEGVVKEHFERLKSMEDAREAMEAEWREKRKGQSA